jgi:hypothetical protein
VEDIMKIKEGLTVREATNYAKDNGYNSVMFCMNVNGKYLASGKFLDAYYDFVQIPIVGNCFVRFNELCDMYGERNISIDILEEEDFKNLVRFDFILRGRHEEIPEEYQADA